MARELVLTNGKVITPFRVIPHGGVAIDGKTISRVFALDEGFVPGVGAEVVDVGGRVIAPGFIDIHLHGGGGADLMDGDPEAALTIARAHAKGGSTAIVPSTLTSSMADLYQALDNIRFAKERMAGEPGFDGARLLGVHLEGPYFSMEFKGAQDPRYLKNPLPEEYRRILDYSRDIIRVSVAPELPGALELGRELRQRGILPSVGHTSATYDELLLAMEAGYKHVTHLYSAMSGVKRINAYRVAGVIEGALLRDDLTAEIIADGRHLPASLIRLAYKSKGADRLALVTDAMRAAGMPEGEYILGSLKDGQKVVVEGGVALLLDRSAFAASVATMNLLVRNAVALGRVPLPEAVRMASATPARIIGVDRTKGRLDAGLDADVVVFDEGDVTVRMTIVEGRVVYNAL